MANNMCVTVWEWDRGYCIVYFLIKFGYYLPETRSQEGTETKSCRLAGTQARGVYTQEKSGGGGSTEQQTRRGKRKQEEARRRGGTRERVVCEGPTRHKLGLNFNWVGLLTITI